MNEYRNAAPREETSEPLPMRSELSTTALVMRRSDTGSSRLGGESTPKRVRRSSARRGRGVAQVGH